MIRYGMPHPRVVRRSPTPLMELPAAASVLAAVAGLMNAWTFQNAGSFATVQSGNIVSAGYFAASGDADRLGSVAASIIAFAVGAAACAVAIGLRSRAGRSYAPRILAAEAVMVLALVPISQAAPALWVAVAVSAVAGAQGNAFHRERGMLYGNTAVTFVLQSTASLLGRALIARRADDGEPHLRPAGAYALVLLAFACGGAGGFLVDRLWSSASLLLAGAVLTTLAVLTALWRRGPVDPRQNAPTP